MAADGSKKSVLAAIAGNTVVCIAKFIGFFMTGSGAMLSEAIHTAADLMNQWLLFFGIVRSSKQADPEFPFGYAKERFVWALVSAVGIFFLGCGVTVYHGIHSLMDPSHEIVAPWWAIGVLLFSLAIEAVVLWVAAKELLTQSRAHGMPFGQYCREAADPSAVAVLLEDAAACLGVIIALMSLGLTMWTGETYWDGIGSITIGLLLGWVAIWLIQRNRMLLVGQAIPQSAQESITSVVMAHPAVENVEEMKTRLVDAHTYNVNLAVDFDGRAIAADLKPHLEASYPAIKEGDFAAFEAFAGNFADEVVERMAKQVQEVEQSIREAVPQASQVDIEPTVGDDE